MPRLHISYRLSLAVAIPAFVVLVGGGLLWRSYVAGKRTVHELTSSVFREVARGTALRTRQHLREASFATDTLSRQIRDHVDAANEHKLFADLEAVMRVHPTFSGVGFADSNGAFAMVRPSDKGKGKVHLNHRRVVTEGGVVRTEVVEEELEEDGRRTPLLTREAKNDPRTRAWYTQARDSKHRVWLPLVRRGVYGLTCAAPRRDTAGEVTGVVSVDFDLDTLSSFIAQLKLSEHGEIFLFSDDGTILAHPRFAQLAHATGAELPTLAAQGGALAEFDRARATGDRHALEFRVDGARWLGRASHAMEERDGPTWYVGLMAPAADFDGAFNRASREALMLGLVALALAVLVAWWLATRISQPLGHLSDDMDAIGRFELDGGDGQRSVFSEIARMQERLAQMRRSLSSFARFVPRDLVRRLVASGHEARLGGELRELTIFFSDIAGFTSFAEKLPPDELVVQLGGYLEAMTATIAASGGTVDKYLGDGILAFWGAPEDDPAHAMNAARTALACQRRLGELAARPEGAWISETKTRIGLATGRVLVGNVGTSERLNYTVMGDIANLASRLESLSKQYGTRMLISAATATAASTAVIARPVDIVAVKGKVEGIRVYELLAPVDAPDAAAARALADAATVALERYLARDFAGAAAAWRAILAQRPDDEPSKVMAERAERFAASPPPADWSGIYEAESK